MPLLLNFLNCLKRFVLNFGVKMIGQVCSNSSAADEKSQDCLICDEFTEKYLDERDCHICEEECNSFVRNQLSCHLQTKDLDKSRADDCQYSLIIEP